MMTRIKAYVRQFTTTLFTAQLDPARAAAAVFLGIFIGIVPIYGFQTIAAILLAALFGLNKPLVFAATFINNPLLQPFLVVSSIEVGSFLRRGRFEPFRLSNFNAAHMKDNLLSWIIGSIVVGALTGSIGGALTALAIRLKRPANASLRDRIRFVHSNFKLSATPDRSFVRWKLRLDRIFGMLAVEDLGSGTVIDLGCGYGMGLCFAAFGGSGRRLVGCDLNPHRIEVARKALSSLNAEVSVGDIRSFGLPSAGLIMIMDVLQYLPAEEQLGLLKRCCSALEPDGRLIFRAHDRERGIWSAITLALDRVLFLWEGTRTRPLILSTPEYRLALESAGMQVETRRFRNRLPLAHVLFIARNTVVETAP